jgi:4-hydroxy-tetrahydrodipicolinate synthase
MTDFDTFGGVYPAMCTPFNDDGSIDFETLRADAQRLESAGVDGLVPMGSTGESATVSHDEHIEVIDAVIDAVDVQSSRAAARTTPRKRSRCPDGRPTPVPTRSS